MACCAVTSAAAPALVTAGDSPTSPAHEVSLNDFGIFDAQIPPAEDSPIKVNLQVTDANVALRSEYHGHRDILNIPYLVFAFLLSDKQQSVHTPLQKWQTRLLRLEFSTTEGPLVGTLAKVDLTFLEGAALHDEERLVTYEALSYTWGEPVFSHTLCINGLELRITETLANFLLEYRLRHAEEDVERWLWVDQICILQSDPLEKAVQVANMLTIYDKAEGVIAWLGPMDDMVEAAFDDCGQQNEIAWQMDAKLVFQSYVTLCERPWFTRVWVQQEVWAARKLELWCGRRSVDWKSFKQQIQDLISPSEHSETGKRQQGRYRQYYDLTGRLVFINDMESHYEQPKNPNDQRRKEILLRLLEGRRLESTDPRDRIYALLGMSKIGYTNPPRPSSGFAVDYTISTVEVFTRFARYIAQGPFNPDAASHYLTLVMASLECDGASDPELKDLPSKREFEYPRDPPLFRADDPRAIYLGGIASGVVEGGELAKGRLLAALDELPGDSTEMARSLLRKTIGKARDGDVLAACVDCSLLLLRVDTANQGEVSHTLVGALPGSMRLVSSMLSPKSIFELGIGPEAEFEFGSDEFLESLDGDVDTHRLTKHLSNRIGEADRSGELVVFRIT
ncbi:uncharacterized protein LTR77_001535 [Saxophila tyrrhenica]|uniref:Heterokaryon incompatibility domain-containing protein n=1 Tax=Saxophila tyrrhenica TaxID=1690608 RepID=A0AAV9PLC1_9PEZI|nr:hypothetical protein LTR77_001535 [Saxophila tyrrhenica]